MRDPYQKNDLWYFELLGATFGPYDTLEKALEELEVIFSNKGNCSSCDGE